MCAVARRPDASSEPAIEITRMRRRHLRRVLNIESRVYPRPWSMTLFLSELSQKHSRTYVVARHGADVVGYAGMMYTFDEAHVTNIAVDPDWQGHKIGSRLLLHIVTEAVARGNNIMSLEVRVSNRAAQLMYEKFGFRADRIRRGYYVETNEDALVMIVDDALSTRYRQVLERIRAELHSTMPPRGHFGETDG